MAPGSRSPNGQLFRNERCVAICDDRLLRRSLRRNDLADPIPWAASLGRLECGLFQDISGELRLHEASPYPAQAQTTTVVPQHGDFSLALGGLYHFNAEVRRTSTPATETYPPARSQQLIRAPS
jgi:hypothetical protein